ncbi:MAG: NAD(P)/FAD-dependent oxidoreductase [Planctomycetaceae bacterium]|nr:NAD(P)/FAD-dependent oxidoreductase [Planctomycetaceae bacterium]
MKNENYDCVVIGAGPGGCTTAAMVAARGFRTALVEREKMPVEKVGESLMPETFWVFEKLGIQEEFQKMGFVRKHGVQFVSAEDKESRPFIFAEHDDQESANSWHVERIKFDQMLYDTAARKGASCLDETRVMDVQFNKNGRHSVIVKDKKGDDRTMKTRVVVDATGQSSFLAGRMGLKEINPDLKKAAIWTYFRGAERAGGKNPEVTCILSTKTKDAWFWYIPLSNDWVSVGLVGDNDFLLKRGCKPEDAFKQEMENCPGLKRRVRDSTQEGKYQVAKEFSYITKEHSGDGWVLVGDAYGFIDPIYSTGVYLALKSADMASNAICDGLRRNDLSAEQLGSWTYEFDAGTHWLRKLVMTFYNKDFSFGSFMKEHPQYAENLTDLLVGKVFEGNPGAMFEDLDPWIEGLRSGAAASA